MPDEPTKRELSPDEFEPQTSEADEKALASLWRNGREAWKDVKSATDWVEKMRGNR
jgi:hypothetical protein